jgi:hypothetical protein
MSDRPHIAQKCSTARHAGGSLIAAHTVSRFAPLFGRDPEPGRKQTEAILAALSRPG